MSARNRIQPDATTWSRMMQYLRDRHAPICRQWFEELEPVSMDAGLMVIRTSTTVQQAYLQKRCVDSFTEAAQDATGQLVAVRFVYRTPGQDTDHGEPERPDLDAITAANGHVAVYTKPTRAGDAAGDLSDQLILHPDHSFENFVQGANNEVAYAAAMAVAENPAKTYNPLYIHGNVGQGKTHLLQAICQRILERNPRFHIVYVSCEKFVNQYITCVGAGLMEAFRHHYRDADMLVVDDIHFLHGDKEQCQEEFFHTFNELHQQQKQLVLSSDAAPHEIPGLTERLVSRFAWGVVTRIAPPTYETRMAILRAKARLWNMDLPADAADYIARKMVNNARELEGAIHTLSVTAKSLGQPVDLALARKALGEAPVEPSSRVVFQRIVDVVTQHYNIRVAELQSKKRHKSVTEPRQVCMFLARQRTGLSLEEIGAFFGGRDHTTVMHSVQKIDHLTRQDAGFAQQLELLTQKVLAV